jgi:nucleoside-diphosphate-sugar epimerase
MKMIAMTGAASFIGQHLVSHLSSLGDIEMRLLVHHHQADLPAESTAIRLFKGDLLKPETLDGFLHAGCTVINLAYLDGASAHDNLKAADNLVEACAKAGVKRLVHCSTAVVAGKVPDNHINEETRCEPVHDYELTKFRVEKLIAERAAGRLDLVVLRPTAVFGPGGKNLLKLADDLSAGSRGLNYFRSCLFGSRRMNLVSVGQVVSALHFLALAEQSWGGSIFIVSDDENPLNNYHNVEKYLIGAVGGRDYSFPRIPIPTPVLSMMLRLAGRSNSNPFRKYDAGKLRAAGFKHTTRFEADLDSFADWYKRRLEDPAAGTP